MYVPSSSLRPLAGENSPARPEFQGLGWVVDLEVSITKAVRRHILYDNDGRAVGWHSYLGFVVDELLEAGATAVTLVFQGYHVRIDLAQIQEGDPPPGGSDLG